MQSTLREIPEDQLQAISGGHISAFATIITILELPHIFMGIREFTNYVTDRWINGSQNVEEGDHFTHFFTSIFGQS